jgi:hypothetical protein
MIKNMHEEEEEFLVRCGVAGIRVERDKESNCGGLK